MLPFRLAAGTAWLAVVGVGVVHLGSRGAMPPPAEPDPRIVALHQELKVRFDPFDRLNPGRSVLTSIAA